MNKLPKYTKPFICGDCGFTDQEYEQIIIGDEELQF